MSDNPWAPIHHEMIDTDEPGSTADPQHQSSSPGARTKGAGAAQRQEAGSSPVGLTLALPQDMIDAMWGAAEQMKRTALAIEENTAATRTLIEELRAAKPPQIEHAA